MQTLSLCNHQFQCIIIMSMTMVSINCSASQQIPIGALCSRCNVCLGKNNHQMSAVRHRHHYQIIGIFCDMELLFLIIIIKNNHNMSFSLFLFHILVPLICLISSSPLLTYHPCLFLFICFLWFFFLLTPFLTLKLTRKPISMQRAVHFPITTHLQLTSIGLCLTGAFFAPFSQ